jgi:hypothetical protein
VLGVIGVLYESGTCATEPVHAADRRAAAGLFNSFLTFF